MPEYSWKSGARFRVSAQVAGERIEYLSSLSGGEVTATQVVADARSDNAPLHGVFEWDDAKAAQTHREDTARLLMRSLRVVVTETKEEEPKSVRAFVHVRREEGTGYMASARAMEDDELRAQVLNRAWGELQAWRQRYRELEELVTVFAAIDEADERRAS